MKTKTAQILISGVMALFFATSLFADEPKLESQTTGAGNSVVAAYNQAAAAMNQFQGQKQIEAWRPTKVSENSYVVTINFSYTGKSK